MAANTIPITGGHNKSQTEVAASAPNPNATNKHNGDKQGSESEVGANPIHAASSSAPRQAAKPVAATVTEDSERTPNERELAAKSHYAPRYETPSRRPADSRSASFSPLAWMADGVTGAIEEVRHNDLGLSQDFWKHLYAVRRESLLTAQALVESLIAKVETKAEEQEQRAKQRERRGSVNIDF